MSFLILLIGFNTWASDQIWLAVGEVRSLPSAPSAVIRVGARGVVRAVDGPRGLKIIGLKPGSTAITVDQKAYIVNVSGPAQKEFAHNLILLTKKMLGLKVKINNGDIQVGGTLLRFSDWEDIAKLAQLYEGKYQFKAKILDDIKESALKKFSHLADVNGLPVLHFISEPQIKIKLPNAASGLLTEVNKIFSIYGITAETNDSIIKIQPLIRTKVILAEVSKVYAERFGIKWPSEYEAQVLPRFNASESLTATLQSLEAKGQAQVLASPTLLCKSGGNANFHAGGEFPIRVISRTTRDVLWKKHGVLLNIKPKADFSGSISLDIETEISILDFANSVDGIPALKTNSVKSHLDLAGSRTIALSGLLRQQLGTGKEGLNLLSKIPVLGALFSSNHFINEKSELVVFVTPEIFVPERSEPIVMPENWNKDYE